MLGMLIPCLKAAEDDLPDPKLFSHPGAYYHLSAPGTKAEGKVIENRSRTTKPNVTEWVYRSGWGTGNHPDGSLSIRWHFIKATEYGDVYVITFVDTDQSITNVPIIYDGKKPLVLKHHEMRFEISESETSTQAEDGAGEPAARPEVKPEHRK